MNLEGKVAFITGGADGIGRGLAEEFLQHEAKVLLSFKHTFCKMNSRNR